MQAVAIKGAGTDGPAVLHASTGAGPCGPLLRGENAMPITRYQTRHRTTVASDDVFRAGLDLTNAAREGLVCLAEGDRLAHAPIAYARRHNVAHDCATIKVRVLTALTLPLTRAH